MVKLVRTEQLDYNDFRLLSEQGRYNAHGMVEEIAENTIVLRLLYVCNLDWSLV